MKKLLLLLLTSILTLNNYSQNDLKARVEFEEAETLFSEAKYKEALEKVYTTEKLIGIWSVNVSFLKIQILDQLSDYSNTKEKYTQQIGKETKLYLKFCEENKDAVVLDKYKIIYEIEKKFNEIQEKEKWLTESDWVSGAAEYRKNNYQSAYNYFKKAVSSGNGYAIHQIGYMNHYGQGVQVNYSEAINWYKKGMDKKIPESFDNMAVLYYSGLGVTKNLTECYNLHLKAASLGYVRSMYVLGLLYEEGQGVAKNMNESVAWYTKACNKNNSEACFQLAYLYHDGKLVKQNFNEAMNLYLKAANMDNGTAMRQIGWMYQNGQGVKLDVNEAKKWYEKSVKLKDTRAMYLLANIYRKYIFDSGTTRIAEAVELYKDAANNGDTDAMLALSEIYKYGEGIIKKDKQYSKMWAEKATAAGASK